MGNSTRSAAACYEHSAHSYVDVLPARASLRSGKDSSRPSGGIAILGAFAQPFENMALRRPSTHACHPTALYRVGLICGLVRNAAIVVRRHNRWNLGSKQG